ncbi:GTP cyclohydrolase I FolE [Lujinxingia sediminis]|uniref:GTP cyclohydrolase I n=1 Tax=Lujinxingia sediminis TaxID=2480984 RepID=A0ABY0CYM2_9DELT|nr:GTP cyclohydrolase I [Lujinxingia sediminis]RVU48763.1 GTP cyclohydrolase I FolE [Lujinxingia sediminis]
MSDEAVEHFRAFMKAVGLNADQDPELARTAERFTGLMDELFSGLHEPAPQISTFEAPGLTESPGSSRPVLTCALPFQSMCVHHLLPFFGTVDVAYVPADHIVGFGSIGRVIDHFAARPQVQERLIIEIAEHLQSTLKPAGLLVRLRARQLCMEMRGAHKHGELISIEARGSLASGELRAECMAQFQRAEKAL